MSDYSHRHAELQFHNGESSLFPIQFSVHEEISRCFVARITARSSAHGLDLSKLVGYAAGLRITGQLTRYFTGVVRSMELSHSEPSAEGMSTYFLVLVPNLWLLSQRRGHRVFQHQTTPEIVVSIFKEWDIEHRLELKDIYPKLEYRVQYGESDLDFVQRLLEDAGVSYYFDVPYSDNQQSTVVLSDDVCAAEVGPIAYHDQPPDAQAGHFCTRLHLGQVAATGSIRFRDFDFRRPDRVTEGAASSQVSSEREKSRENYHFSPGGFLIETDDASETPVADDKSIARHNDNVGAALAERRLVAMQYRRRSIEVESNHLHLFPGIHFRIGGAPEHPRADLNGRPWRVIESQVVGNATGEMSVTLAAVDAGEPFRSPMRTPRPRIDGVQSALVVGPPGKEIYTDEHGRVRVRFHWDREGRYDDNRSCWLRVSQELAGAGYGAVTLPRIGHEVLVEFLDGDPDQPVIVGRLYNGTAKAPFVLPANKTKSGFRTQTTPFVDGHYNEMLMDDQADNELFRWQAQRNMMRLIKNDATYRVGHDHVEVVGEHRLRVVRKVDAEHVGERFLVQMVKERSMRILQQGDPRLKAGSTWLEVRDKRITLTTGDAAIVLDGPDVQIYAEEGVRFSAKKDLTIKGSMLYLNADKAEVLSPEAQGEIDDAVRSIDDKDRVAAAVKELLRLRHREKDAQKVRRSWAFSRRQSQRNARRYARAKKKQQKKAPKEGLMAKLFKKQPPPEHPYTADEEGPSS